MVAVLEASMDAVIPLMQHGYLSLFLSLSLFSLSLSSRSLSLSLSLAPPESRRTVLTISLIPSGPTRARGMARPCSAREDSSPNSPKQWSPCKWVIMIALILVNLMSNERMIWCCVPSPQSTMTPAQPPVPPHHELVFLCSLPSLLLLPPATPPYNTSTTRAPPTPPPPTTTRALTRARSRRHGEGGHIAHARLWLCGGCAKKGDSGELGGGHARRSVRVFPLGTALQMHVPRDGRSHHDLGRVHRVRHLLLQTVTTVNGVTGLHI